MKLIEKKINHMLNHGFKLMKCTERCRHVLTYKGYAWTISEVQETPLEEIKEYIKGYDSEKEMCSF